MAIHFVRNHFVDFKGSFCSEFVLCRDFCYCEQTSCGALSGLTKKGSDASHMPSIEETMSILAQSLGRLWVHFQLGKDTLKRPYADDTVGTDLERMRINHHRAPIATPDMASHVGNL